MPTMKLGIAAYLQLDGRGRPTSPHWALVAHPTSFSEPDVMVFQITQRGPRQWDDKHKICSLLSAPTLIGVIDLGTAKISAAGLTAVAQETDPNNSDRFNPSGLMFWSCSSWVIKVLNALQTQRSYALSVPVDDVYDRVMERIQTMKGGLPNRERVPSDPLQTVAF